MKISSLKIKYLFFILVFVVTLLFGLLFLSIGINDGKDIVSYWGTFGTVLGLIFIIRDQYKIKSNIETFKHTFLQDNLRFGLHIIETIEWQIDNSKDFNFINSIYKKFLECIIECKKCCEKDDIEKFSEFEKKAISWRVKISSKSINGSNTLDEKKFKQFLGQVQLFIIKTRPIYGANK